jgi:basic membrane lipoprotein Med (substrate-binding protein (PBP1-ABC) superfamily)
MNLRKTFAATVAALAAAGCATAAAEGPHHDKVVVVLGGEAAKSPAMIEQAKAAVARMDDAQLRVPQSSTEELGVTHLFAARGYDTIVAIDLDRHVSVDPVAERYPSVRFIDVTSHVGSKARLTWPAM